MVKRILTLYSFILVNFLSIDEYPSCAIIAIKISTEAFAQETKYPLEKYHDRIEGIAKPPKLVAGEKLFLISATIEHEEPMPAEKKMPHYNLRFHLEDSARIKIEVWEYDKPPHGYSYKMEPLRRIYAAGHNDFTWPSTISLYYQIGLHDLLPLAKTLDSSRSIILPVALYHTTPDIKGMSYSFCFIPTKTVDTLEYKIYNTQTAKLVNDGILTGLLKDNKFYIRWDGKDRNQRIPGNGLYELILTATFRSPRGLKKMPPVITSNQFYHYAGYLKLTEVMER